MIGATYYDNKDEIDNLKSEIDKELNLMKAYYSVLAKKQNEDANHIRTYMLEQFNKVDNQIIKIIDRLEYIEKRLNRPWWKKLFNIK